VSRVTIFSCDEGAYIVPRKCNSALVHPTLGVLILPTVISFSRMLSRLAIGLDKQPELIAHLARGATDDGGVSETLPERAANIVRQAFVTCLNDRSSGVKDGKPEGKKIGIYKAANLVLKILFQCRKNRNAEQIFVNIDNQSPPLAIYPRAERVTYLYYLGRYLFSVNQFYRAKQALQEAHSNCRNSCLQQKRLILVYLIASNIILGRFPSTSLYQRPEAIGLGDIFHPICKSIASGDFVSFQSLLGYDAPYASWFLKFRILLPLRTRGEVLVWRSLIRKTFLINGAHGDTTSRKAHTVALEDVLVLYRALEQRLDKQAGNNYVDADLDGIDDDNGTSREPDMLQMESICSSLVEQGLLNGYISHSQRRFAIQGARQKGSPLIAGFPVPYQVISNNCDDHVPGWKKQQAAMAGQPRFGPGMVVNLSGARPAGSGG
jgi:hypothetical protein